jgi:hypothetical protein
MTEQDKEQIQVCLSCTASPPECDNQHSRAKRCEFIRRYGKLTQPTKTVLQDIAGNPEEMAI